MTLSSTNTSIPKDVQSPTSTLSIAQKIRLLRKHKNMTQTELADIIWTNTSRISHIENGDNEYNQKELNDIREHFEIVGMPFTELERIAFRERLYIWRDFIRDGRMHDAKELQVKISPVLNLEPCDPDLATLYRLFEVLLLLSENDLDTAEEKLAYLEGIFADMNTENRYYLFCMLGTLSAVRNCYEEALRYYKRAYGLIESSESAYSKDNVKLFANMAICYTRLEFPCRAISFLNRIRGANGANSKRQINLSNLAIDIALANNLAKISDFKDAKKILDSCLVQAKALDSSKYVGIVLFNLGILHRRLKDWKVAINYFNQAMDTFDVDSEYYPMSFFYKVNCAIDSGGHFNIERIIGEGEPIYSKDPILFDSLEHILILNKRMSIYNEDSAEYIETKTIPHLINGGARLEAINLYRLLDKHYEKVRKHKKSMLMKIAVGDIYERMFVKLEDGDII